MKGNMKKTILSYPDYLNALFNEDIVFTIHFIFIIHTIFTLHQTLYPARSLLSFRWIVGIWLLFSLVLRQNNISVWEQVHVHVVRELSKLVRVDWRKNDRFFDNFFFPRHCGIPQRTTTIILPEKGKKNISQQQHFPKN